MVISKNVCFKKLSENVNAVYNNLIMKVLLLADSELKLLNDEEWDAFDQSNFSLL